MGEWRRLRIGDIARQRKGSITISDDIEYKLCRVQLHRKGVLLRETLPGAAIKTKKQQVCKTGDLIVAEMDAKFGGYGFIGEELDGAIVSSHYYLYELDLARISKEYFLVLIHSGTIQNQIEAKGSTNYSSIRGWEFLDYEILVPSLELQHQIASRFNTCFSAVNTHESQALEQLSLLKQLRQAVLQEAVEGKLTVEWRKQHPVMKGDPHHDAVTLLAQIKGEKERLMKEGKIRNEKPLPQIADADKPFDLPDGWVWCRLSDICDAQDPNPSHRMPKYVQAGIPFISPMNVDSKGNINFSIGKKVAEETYQLQCQTYSIKSNSFAFSRIGTIGLVFNLPLPQNYCLSHSLSVITPILDENEYLMKLLSSQTILQQATHGVTKNTVPDLGMKTIRSFVIPLPPLAEQQVIVARVDSLMAVIDELEMQVAERKEQSQLLMQTVLREAFDSDNNTTGGVK